MDTRRGLSGGNAWGWRGGTSTDAPREFCGDSWTCGTPWAPLSCRAAQRSTLAAAPPKLLLTSPRLPATPPAALLREPSRNGEVTVPTGAAAAAMAAARRAAALPSAENADVVGGSDSSAAGWSPSWGTATRGLLGTWPLSLPLSSCCGVETHKVLLSCWSMHRDYEMATPSQTNKRGVASFVVLPPFFALMGVHYHNIVNKACLSTRAAMLTLGVRGCADWAC